MENFLFVLGKVYELFNHPMTIYGFTFSLWDMLMFGLVVGVVIKFVGYMFYEN